MMLDIQTKTKLLIGFFFILFDYNVDAGPMNFVAFPTFIGFLLIWWGISDIAQENELFAKLKKTSLLMTPVFFLIFLNQMYDWLSSLLSHILASDPENAVFVNNTTALFKFIAFTLNIILILSVVYAVYLLACGFKEMSDKKGGAYPSYGKQLFNTFQIYAALKALQLIVYTMSTFGIEAVDLAANVFSLCAIVPSIMFIMQINRLYNMLYPKK